MTEQAETAFGSDWGYSACFGCGPENPIGMKLVFRKDGEKTVGEFTPTELHQGWNGLVHGGIIICLLDEAMAYAARFETGDLPCVTGKIEARLKRATATGQRLLISARVTGKSRKLIKTSATVSAEDGSVIAEGKSTQFIVKSAEK